MLTWLLALVLAAAPAAAPTIPYTRYTLPNGLTVILSEDHTTPGVVVNVWLKVGSRDEKPGRSGFAHLFEHLMFMGSRNAPGNTFDALMERLGGQNNAWTSNDWTDYFEWGPSGLLPVFLWLEGDRLATVGPEMTKQKLDLQRDVVRNERRQTTENRPYGMAELLINEHLFPKGHPYHHPVIGSHEDLEAATVDDVKDFFARYYVASNASLVIVGDFKTEEAKQLVDKYLGWLPARPVPERPAPPPVAIDKPRELNLQDAVQLPRVYQVWLSPASFQPGDAEMMVLAQVLGGGKSSRLERALVHERQIASRVAVQQDNMHLQNAFYIEATARQGRSIAELEAALDEELRKALATPPTAAELDRARTQIETGLWHQAESMHARAQMLNRYQVFLGEPSGVARDLARYAAVTPEGVHELARKTLDPQRKLTVRVTPKQPEQKGAGK